MQGRREFRPFLPLGEDEALGTLGGQNQDQTQEQGGGGGGGQQGWRAALSSPSLWRQTHCLQLLLGSFGQFRQIQAVNREGEARYERWPGHCWLPPSMQGAQGAETLRPHTKPPPGL